MRKVFLIVLIAASMFGNAYAQKTETLSVSLKDAQRYAWSHNLSVVNGDLAIQKAKRVQWQTLATMLPQISGTAEYQNYCGFGMIMETGIPGMKPIEIAMNPAGTLAGTASITLSGAQIVGTLIHKTAIEMTDISAEKNKQQISSAVAQLYSTILATESTVGLLEQSLENIKKLHQTTLNSVKVGVVEQVDADQLSIQVSSIENTISSTKRSLEMLYNALRLQMGTSIDCKLILTDKLDNVIDAGVSQRLVSKNFNMERNFDYQLLSKNLDLLQQQITLSIMDYLPSVTGFYQYSAKTYFGKDAGMNMTPPHLVGVSVKVPIWSSGVRTTKLQETKISYRMAENEFIMTNDALRIQERQLKYNLVSAYENYETQNKNIEISERVFANISNKYEYGRASSLDVTNASTNLISSQANYIKSIIDLTNAQIELKKLLNITE